MKKIFTLLVSVTLFASAFAQYRNDGNKDFGNKGKDAAYNDGSYKKGNDPADNYFSFGTKERDMQIAQINRDYDRRIMEVKNRVFMARYKKDQMVHQLNDQRNDEIRMVYAKFSSRDNHYEDHHDDHDSRRH